MNNLWRRILAEAVTLRDGLIKGIEAIQRLR